MKVFVVLDVSEMEVSVLVAVVPDVYVSVLLVVSVPEVNVIVVNVIVVEVPVIEVCVPVLV